MHKSPNICIFLILKKACSPTKSYKLSLAQYISNGTAMFIIPLTYGKVHH